jgi:hypothetical protein
MLPSNNKLCKCKDEHHSLPQYSVAVQKCVVHILEFPSVIRIGNLMKILERGIYSAEKPETAHSLSDIVALLKLVQHMMED